METTQTTREPADEIRERGYAIVPLLGPDDVRALRRRYLDLGLLAVHNYSSIHEVSAELKVEISEVVSSMLRKRLPSVGLARSRVMGGVFVVKAPTTQYVEAHQAPALVDESRYRSANVWVPLQDVDVHNGCLWLLPGSQHDAPIVRPGNGDDCPSYYSRISKDSIWDAMIPIELRAGEALVYDHRMLHGSKGNYTDEPRLAVVGGLRSIGAAPRYYHADPSDGSVAVFEMEDSDFFSFINFVPQSGHLIGRTVIGSDFLDPAEFARRYEAGPAPVQHPHGADLVDAGPRRFVEKARILMRIEVTARRRWFHLQR